MHNESPSLVEFLTLHKKPLHFVNRLDRETSGLVAVAKTPELHKPLSLALDNGRKIYRALLRGPWKHQTPLVIWSWALTDKSEGRKNPQGVTKDRVPCESRAELIRTNKYFTEVNVEIFTGRQHQIRKHATLSGQPIVGDNRYNDKSYNEKMAARYKLDRLWLHAEKLEFTFKDESYFFERHLNLDLFF